MMRIGLSFRLALLGCLTAGCVGLATAQMPPQILYGAAYYNEYMPTDRLDEDIRMMKAAHFNVVRMGESTWSLWEPEDGRFEYAWMDRVVDAMGKAGIKVILGTPTYSIPVWMYAKHPEIMVRPLGASQAISYGGRQNMDFSNPVFRKYAERLIRNLVSHYRENPAVIAWQIDNETGSYDAANEDVVQGFVDHLRTKFGTVEKLNQAWFLNYWGQDIDSWSHVPPSDKATSTSYKLEWSRWQQQRVTDYLTWQAALVREYRGRRQVVLQDFANAMHNDVDELSISKALDVVAANSYHPTQDDMDGEYDALVGDYMRSLKQSNYLITETNAQTTDWSSAFQFPPYDGQLRLNVYTHLSNGAAMVEYWHWHSIHAGQETYWKGVLSHDLQANRAYAEISRTGAELEKLSPHLQGFKIRNDVAILYSVDSSNGLHFMPFTYSVAQWEKGQEVATYADQLHQFHQALYRMNVGADFIFPTTDDLARYKLIIVPSLYIADDALLKRLSDYVRGGGHVVMAFKSGFANENSAVRWEMAPGPLREVAGFRYQEFSNLKEPLSLKGDPFQVGSANRVQYWAEFLIPEHARPLAYYDHPFFGRWPAITRNEFGKGDFTYEGTSLSNTLQMAVLRQEVERAGISVPALPANIRLASGKNSQGHVLHYFLNFSSAQKTLRYVFAPGTDILTERPIATGTDITIAPWDLAIVEEP